MEMKLHVKEDNNGIQAGDENDCDCSGGDNEENDDEGDNGDNDGLLDHQNPLFLLDL